MNSSIPPSVAGPRGTARIIGYNRKVPRLHRFLAVILTLALLGGLLTALMPMPLFPGPLALASLNASLTPSPLPTLAGHTATSTPTFFLAATSTTTSTASPTLPAPAFVPTRPPARKTARPTPTKTLAPSPASTLPESALIDDIYGFGQTLPLSCEARAAVDWARFFGTEIAELEFFNRLPKADDPELGFVGSPYGAWGEIPPYPYGVHAAPVADTLREYGLKARAERGMSFEEIKGEVAAGRPLIVWVVGHVEKGVAVQIKVGGQERTVARYEHTVMLIGYTASTVTILDNGNIYQRSNEVFLASWGALENQAVFWHE